MRSVVSKLPPGLFAAFERTTRRPPRNTATLVARERHGRTREQHPGRRVLEDERPLRRWGYGAGVSEHPAKGSNEPLPQMTNYHQKKTIRLKSIKSIARIDLHKWLIDRGYRSIDDFYTLFRKGRIDIWQSRSVFDINVFHQGSEVYETIHDLDEGNGTVWDELECSYLLASLPQEYIAVFVNEIDALAHHFELQMCFEGRFVLSDQIGETFNECADYLTQEYGEPGSELLAILIQLEYQK